ncbi:potassium channel family protein [uncultured Halomonas sp.]|uniref:potassium channel family protein n=1 Tax=uncultured Halomonas sp. TaxID=173971 RepID=UPI0026022A81|nr:potassium channel family protein [uncultured Halomonas sp.]
MTNIALLIAGITIVLVTLYDLCKSTLSLAGAGPITRGVSGGVWGVARRLGYSLDMPLLLRAPGPTLVLLLLLSWVLLFWSGWWLIFTGNPYSVVNSTTYQPASLAERAYFVGYTLTTLGYGDYTPLQTPWKLASILCAINGFTLFTLAITYWLSIVSSVVKKRKLALMVSRLGETPIEILENTRGSGDFSILGNKLENILEDITEIGQQQHAYPILHYYHTSNVKEALPVSLTKLYISLQVVNFGCSSLSCMTRFEVTSAIATLDDFLASSSGKVSTRRSARVTTHVDDKLGFVGFDKSHSDILDHLETLPLVPALTAYLTKEGWQWKEVWRRKTCTS